MFLYYAWTQLNINTRHKLAAHFNIIKKGSTEVVDNQIKSDGYAVKDIEQALNVEAIQIYLNTQETGMARLWTMLINKMEGREVKEDVIQPPVQVPKIVPISDLSINDKPVIIKEITIDEAQKQFGTKKKGGRPKKNV